MFSLEHQTQRQQQERCNLPASSALRSSNSSCWLSKVRGRVDHEICTDCHATRFHSANYHQIQHQLAMQQQRQHSQSQLSRQQQGHMQQHARMPAQQHQVMTQMRANMIATQQPPYARSQEMQLQTPAAGGRGGSTAQYPILNPHMRSTRGT